MTTADDRCRLFFRPFFDEFDFFEFSEKGYWARCFGKTFWVVREGPGKTGFIFQIFRIDMLDQVLRKGLLRVTTVDDRCRLFFRPFFDEFDFFDFSEKGHWARCFGKLHIATFLQLCLGALCFRIEVQTVFDTLYVKLM